ncbi:MAG: hypothetical protein ABI723_18820 [Bacteroidia bacterium]
MKKLLLLIAAVSFTAATYAQSAQSTTAAPAPAKTETKKECCTKGSSHSCCKSTPSGKASTGDKVQTSDKAAATPAATKSTPAPKN